LVPKAWSYLDFFLVLIGGLVGLTLVTVVFALIGDSDWIIPIGVAGQYVGSLFVFWVLRKGKEDPEVGLRIERLDWLFVLAGLVLQLALALALVPIASRLLPEGLPPQPVAEAISDTDISLAVRVTLAALAVLLAPVVEELLFRGILIKAMIRLRPIIISVVTALVFTAFHLPSLLETDQVLARAAVVLPPIFVLGLVLGTVTLQTKRLGPAVLMHIGWNLTAGLVLLLPAELLDSIS
jgi:membrane protease YdiL (CAAX protease family)